MSLNSFTDLGMPDPQALMLRFNQEYPDEEACLHSLFSILSAVKAVICHSCCSPDLERICGRRVICLSCGRSFSFTAGTFFARVRKLRAWFAAIWLLEEGMILSAGRLGQIIGMATSSAWSLLKKINLVLYESRENLDCIRLSPDSLAAAICKRSTLTPASTHPLNEHINRQSSEQQFSFEMQFFAPLGLISEVQPAATAESFGSAAVESKLVAFIKSIFHGTSVKYLQLAVTSFWCFTDRQKWGRGAILERCANNPTLCFESISTFVSPVPVLLPSSA